MELAIIRSFNSCEMHQSVPETICAGALLKSWCGVFCYCKMAFNNLLLLMPPALDTNLEASSQTT